MHISATFMCTPSDDIVDKDPGEYGGIFLYPITCSSSSPYVKWMTQEEEQTNPILPRLAPKISRPHPYNKSFVTRFFYTPATVGIINCHEAVWCVTKGWELPVM